VHADVTSSANSIVVAGSGPPQPARAPLHARASSRSSSATFAPRAASTREHAAPIPLAPPLTTVTPDGRSPNIVLFSFLS
jgi:hypothetical protein